MTDCGLCADCHLEAEERTFDIIELAREQRQEEGLVEIDDTAQISEGNDNGCYVAAWVWVDFADTKFDKEKGNHETQATAQANHTATVAVCPDGQWQGGSNGQDLRPPET